MHVRCSEQVCVIVDRVSITVVGVNACQMLEAGACLIVDRVTHLRHFSPGEAELSAMVTIHHSNSPFLEMLRARQPMWFLNAALTYAEVIYRV